MKKHLWLFASAVVIVGLLFAVFAGSSVRVSAQSQDSERGGPPGGAQGGSVMKEIRQLVMVGRLASTSDFKKWVGPTSDQQNRIAAFAEKSASAQKENSNRLTTLDKELTTLLNADTPDVAKLEAKVDEISAVQAKNNLLLLREALDIKSTLTADQWKKTKEYLAKQEKNRSQRSSGPGGGPGGGPPSGGGRMGGPPPGGGW